MTPGASPGGGHSGGKGGGKGGHGYTGGGIGSCGYGQFMADQRPKYDNCIRKRKKKKKHEQ